MVNNTYTIIWQALEPIPSDENQSNEYENTLDIYILVIVNYTINTLTPSLGFTPAGANTPIFVGQEVILDENGIFGKSHVSASGVITINNNLGGSPHEVLAAPIPLSFLIAKDVRAADACEGWRAVCLPRYRLPAVDLPQAARPCRKERVACHFPAAFY